MSSVNDPIVVSGTSSGREQNTMLAKLGFQDADRKTATHELACQYLLQEDVIYRLVQQMLDKSDVFPCDIVGVPEFHLTKGERQYRTTVGFIDGVVRFCYFNKQSARNSRTKKLKAIRNYRMTQYEKLFAMSDWRTRLSLNEWEKQMVTTSELPTPECAVMAYCRQEIDEGVNGNRRMHLQELISYAEVSLLNEWNEEEIETILASCWREFKTSRLDNQRTFLDAWMLAEYNKPLELRETCADDAITLIEHDEIRVDSDYDCWCGGFVDLSTSMSLNLKEYEASILIEVKTGNTSVSDCLRQIQMYKEYYQHAEPNDKVSLVLVTTYPLTQADVETLKTHGVKHFKLGKAFLDYCNRAKSLPMASSLEL